jgi:hypothetical protein
LDPVVAPIIMTFACAIVLFGWLAAAGLIGVFVHRLVAKREAEHPEELAEAPDSALLFYALSVFFWPAGFMAGAYFLKRARTARQGRNCVYIGLTYLTVIVVLTCAGMVAVSFMAPEWLP